MRLYLTRDSVHAGDDGDAPHERTLTVPDRSTLDQVLAAVAAARYLPEISGGLATWSVASNLRSRWSRSTVAEAAVAVPDGIQVRALDWQGDTLRLQFNYHAQADPELVLDVLKRLRLRAE
jgi:hypothetical protein